MLEALLEPTSSVESDGQELPIDNLDEEDRQTIEKCTSPDP